jgi:hypothetical protein
MKIILMELARYPSNIVWGKGSKRRGHGHMMYSYTIRTFRYSPLNLSRDLVAVHMVAHDAQLYSGVWVFGRNCYWDK